MNVSSGENITFLEDGLRYQYFINRTYKQLININSASKRKFPSELQGYADKFNSVFNGNVCTAFVPLKSKKRIIRNL